MEKKCFNLNFNNYVFVFSLQTVFYCQRSVMGNHPHNMKLFKKKRERQADIFACYCIDKRLPCQEAGRNSFRIDSHTAKLL